ncbi:MAG: hypothetical protein ACRECO_20790 [Xanthobacteraceae bacterium]
MTVCRALLVAVLASITLHQAGAQFGGMPGLPGSPGFKAAPAAPPPACKALLTLRDEVQKHGGAIQNANKKRANVQTACKLFKNFIAAEAKMLRAIERDGGRCGVPADAALQIKSNHAQAVKVANQVCEAAAQASRPAGPSLSDALGTTPPIPERNSKNSKKGAGTFETLTGNPLVR